MQGNAEVIASFVGDLDGGVQVLGIGHLRKVNHIHPGSQPFQHGGEAFGDRRRDGVFFKPVPAGPGVVGMAYINSYFPDYSPLMVDC